MKEILSLENGGVKSRGWVLRLLLVALPLGLVISSGIGLWLFLKHEKKLKAVEQARFTQGVSVKSVADDLNKIVNVIGERNAESEKARANLSRMAAMIEGSLGPGNTGYEVKKISVMGNSEWPILLVGLKGSDLEKQAIWVITSYDSPQNSRGAESNASGVVSVAAAAAAMSQDILRSRVNFVFVPHGSNAESNPNSFLVRDTGAELDQLTKVGHTAPHIFVVEAMGAGRGLFMSSRGGDNGNTKSFGELATRYPLDDYAMKSRINRQWSKTTMQAERISSSLPSKPLDNEILPSAENVAASTIRLIELIRRAANE